MASASLAQTFEPTHSACPNLRPSASEKPSSQSELYLGRRRHAVAEERLRLLRRECARSVQQGARRGQVSSAQTDCAPCRQSATMPEKRYPVLVPGAKAIHAHWTTTLEVSWWSPTCSRRRWPYFSPAQARAGGNEAGARAALFARGARLLRRAAQSSRAHRHGEPCAAPHCGHASSSPAPA
eukprot:scaffold294_cov131-Isochrysis_galbana.AAC.8